MGGGEGVPHLPGVPSGMPALTHARKVVAERTDWTALLRHALACASEGMSVACLFRPGLDSFLRYARKGADTWEDDNVRDAVLDVVADALLALDSAVTAAQQDPAFAIVSCRYVMARNPLFNALSPDAMDAMIVLWLDEGIAILDGHRNGTRDTPSDQPIP